MSEAKYNNEDIFKVLDECKSLFDDKSRLSKGISKYIVEYYSIQLSRLSTIHSDGSFEEDFLSYEGDDFGTDELDKVFEHRLNTRLESTFLDMYKKAKVDKTYFDAMNEFAVTFCGKNIPKGLIYFTKDRLNNQIIRPRKIKTGGDLFVRDLMLSCFVFGLKHGLDINPTINVSSDEQAKTGCGLVAQWNKINSQGSQGANTYESVRRIYSKKMIDETKEQFVAYEIAVCLSRLESTNNFEQTLK